MSDIFLSYSRIHRTTAQLLVRALERRGWSVFWDYDIRTAEDFHSRISAEAEGAGCVVVLWSRESIASEWVLLEAEIGLRRKRLLPALIETVSPPREFAQLNAVDLAGWAPDTLHEGFKDLLEAIVDLLGIEPWKRLAFETALRNIAQFGDTDVFPYPIERNVFAENRRESLELIHRIDVKFKALRKDFPPDYEPSLFPAGFYGFRWVTQIDPIWNAYLLGLVTAIGGDIEAARSRVAEGTVFSHRFKPDERTGALFDTEIGWRQYQERSLALAKEFGHVVVCDVADFYARISHEDVRLALERSKAAPEVIERIVDLLAVFSGGDPYGLPIGGPASRLLSELILHTVDSLLSTEGVPFCRFADDYHVFADDERHAYQRLMLLHRLLLQLGLTLQKSKTRIMSAEKFTAAAERTLAAGERAEERWEGDRWTRLKRKAQAVGPYNAGGAIELEEDEVLLDELRREIDKYDLREMLARELEKTRPDATRVRWLIDAVKLVDSENRNLLVRAFLETRSLERLYPQLSYLLRTFHDVVEPRYVMSRPGHHFGLEDDTRFKIFDKLSELIESGSYLMGIPAYLSGAVRVLAYDPRPSTDRVLALAFATDSIMVKSDVILAMVRRRNEEWIRLQFRRENLTTGERRALLIASTTLGSEGLKWQKRIADRISPMDILVLEWAKGKASAGGPGLPW